MIEKKLHEILKCETEYLIKQNFELENLPQIN